MKKGKKPRQHLVRHAKTVKGHGMRVVRGVRSRFFNSPKKIALSSAVLVLALIVLAQLFFPYNAVAWFARVDGIEIGGVSKDEATKRLDAAYAKAEVPIFYKDQSDAPKASPALPEIGTQVSNAARVDQFGYPWYWRLVPSSALWYHATVTPGEVTASFDKNTLGAYMSETFGAECVIAPVNATVALKDTTLEVVPAKDGGTCDYDELYGALEAVTPSVQPKKIVVDGTTIAPEVNDETAQEVIDQVLSGIGEGVVVSVNGVDEVIAKNEVVGWLVFTPEESSLTYSFNEKSQVWLNENFGKKVAVAAGTSRVSTLDFVETSRVNGAPGRAINVATTADSILNVIKSDTSRAVVITAPVAPTVVYTRSYSPTDTGITALLKHYAETHPGTYGISFIELTGARRNANYNGGTQFTTASTFKLFVAYSTLLRVEKGEWSWNDQISGGRNLTKCFDDMIVKSDNPCAEALLAKIGFRNITNEAKAIGAVNTSFLGSNGIKSTAQDQAIFLSALQSGQMLSQQSSRDAFLNALRRNVYRQGIPAGASGAVANKVGFLDGLLHDSGIVYSPSGTYVLVIMTDGSSWANIAELTRQLEVLRAG